ncbi:hypothetical protein PAXRUDRAFT_19153 [Paxillus rubicundulus Ve08.2h10]|uniref:Unplaced genomic scaffold scaffold_3417, whole genome shotgun sequence n=1 Tax=Paxillus rubicundulus Ve08.2h10 TaxID=930991 RepID=A0A0D0BV03_9AGAM|nr:hypothetical protein PAXRUDRAFT_19153 [Paxillus rubicundulus Ve08.2h10]
MARGPFSRTILEGETKGPVELDPNKEGANQRRTAAKGKRKATPDHGLTDVEESEEGQADWTDEEELDI